MANPLYGAMGNDQMANIIKQVQDFQRNFKGDPKQVVEQMVASGQIPQNVFNELAQQANQIIQFMK